MLRPRWIALLLLCLVVAGRFRLARPVAARAGDRHRPARRRARPRRCGRWPRSPRPGEYLPEPLVGQRVTVEGTWVADDFLVVTSRFNDDVEGYWVTGQLPARRDTETPASVAVAIGWAATAEDAQAAIERVDSGCAAPTPRPSTVTGRLISDEGPLLPPSGATRRP